MVTVIDRPPHTLAFCQGPEMSGNRGFSRATDMRAHSCDPASPRQRGTTENTNGLLRQCLPERRDLGSGSLDELSNLVITSSGGLPSWSLPSGSGSCGNHKSH